jgi:hypothetical protein
MSSTLFQNHNGALFSPCRKYRYKLWRVWDNTKPMITFIGLNPSTANETSDDPTIRRVITFAKTWGYGGVNMMNLFAWVSPHPQDLKTVEDPLGDNDKLLKAVAEQSAAIVFAWGTFKEAQGRGKDVKRMFPDALALGINADGSPKHPLYIKGDTLPIKYEELCQSL